MGFPPPPKDPDKKSPHRFDDPTREHRTVYCAEQRLTALRETLADFRPNAAARAEYRELFDEDLPPPTVTALWLESRVLAPATIRIVSGDLVSIDDAALRQEFAKKHWALLIEHGMDHLDISQVRSKARPVTQALVRHVLGQGGAGILYGSNLDDLPCAALFEHRAFLSAHGASEPLTLDHPDLMRVCQEFGLLLAGPQRGDL